MTSYNGQAITYDEIGNPLSYDGWTFVWESGRQLKRMTKDGSTIDYKYDDSGIRTSKTVNGVTTNYTTIDGRITSQNDGTNFLYFRYDSNNELVGVQINGTEYIYLKNLQGDVVSILDMNGQSVVNYTYDAWGMITSITGSMADTIGNLNPMRYRGYYFDNESGYYYLQSRYYDSNTCRFINADESSVLELTKGQAVGHNLFAYCYNNPVNNVDPNGNQSITAWHFTYNRKAAIAYAHKWYNSRNSYYYSYSADCANFVSQCLYAGGVPMELKTIFGEGWHCFKTVSYIRTLFHPLSVFLKKYRYNWDISPSWSLAAKQFKYFKNSRYRRSVITLYSEADIKEAIKNNKIQKGDIMYFDDDGNGTPNHATIISSVDNNMIYYSAHTKSRFDKKLNSYLTGKSKKRVYIITIIDYI